MTDNQASQDETSCRGNPAPSLRDRAEETILAKRVVLLKHGPPLGEALHELRVYQTELEMQNEELRQTLEELEAAKTKYFGFYNISPVGYFTIGGNGLILEVNLTAAIFLGMLKGNLLNQPFTSLIAAEDQDAYYMFRKRLFETGANQSCEIRVARADGSRLWFRVEASTVQIAGSDRPAFNVVMSDITERNLAVAELRRAKEQAESATKLKDKFVEMVAHDLRSPLASMMSLLRFFAERKRYMEDEENKKVFDIVFNSGDRMIAMIQELLKLSRLQSGRITPQPRFIRGHMAVGNTIESLAHTAMLKGIEIINEIPADMRLYADEALFNEVLLNFLSNAIKFCSSGDKIAFFAPPGLKSAIAIRDSGKGFDENVIANLFRHDLKTTTPGTMGEVGAGLGLPYCHAIMKAHGGEITVESAPGKGSVFCAALPYVKPVALIVDDDPTALMLLGSHLKEIGIEVIEALNGEQALAALKDKLPHIIITDVKMPVMDGFTLLSRLKQDSATKEIPVIVMTSSDSETREKAFLLGADDFVGKPVLREDFIPRIRRFVG